jgi:hypothetical protein
MHGKLTVYRNCPRNMPVVISVKDLETSVLDDVTKLAQNILVLLFRPAV